MYGLDLFSGIGGITKALERYVRPVAYCENDRYAQAVLLSRMREGLLPTAPIWDDVRTLQGSMLPVRPDIIYGGFPCQDISVAGRGAGLAGKRSGLFFEIVRLIGEIRPRFVFLENVPVIRTRGADTVGKELSRLGFDCRWITLSAAEIGANHKRERWFLLAYTSRKQNRRILPIRLQSNTRRESENVANTDEPGSQRRLGKILQKCSHQWTARTSSASNVSDPESAECTRLGTEPRGEPNGLADGSWWQLEPDVGRVAHGVPFRVDRLRGLGNSVVPAQAREAFERLMGLK